MVENLVPWRPRGWAGFFLLVLAAAGGAWLSLMLLLGTAYAVPTPPLLRAIAAMPAGALPSQQLERAFPSLSYSLMVHMTHAGDGTNRLWVVLKTGRIMVLSNDQTTSSSQVFLDISGRVSTTGGVEDEEGLLGMAFDPGYASNGYFYVYYSAASPRRSVISRFSVSSGDANQADSQSELVLLQINQPFSNHNGGEHLLWPRRLSLHRSWAMEAQAAIPSAMGRTRLRCWAPFCVSMWVGRPPKRLIASPLTTPWWARRAPEARYGPTVCATRGNSRSTPLQGTCGPPT